MLFFLSVKPHIIGLESSAIFDGVLGRDIIINFTYAVTKPAQTSWLVPSVNGSLINASGPYEIQNVQLNGTMAMSTLSIRSVTSNQLGSVTFRITNQLGSATGKAIVEGRMAEDGARIAK